MASLQQEQQLSEIAPTSRGNSKRITALNLHGQSPPSIDDHGQQVSIILLSLGFFFIYLGKFGRKITVFLLTCFFFGRILYTETRMEKVPVLRWARFSCFISLS